MTFNPKDHMTNLKGKDYLEVKWRLVWFREVHPMGGIATEVIGFEPLLVKATVVTGVGVVLITGHASAVAKAGAVWSGRDIEKAETAAIGRALGHAGFGTQFEGDENEGDYLADSPVERKPTQNAAMPPPDVKNGHSTEDLRNTVLLKDALGVFWGMARQYYDNGNHMTNSVNKMLSEGILNKDTMTVHEAIEIVKNRKVTT